MPAANAPPKKAQGLVHRISSALLRVRPNSWLSAGVFSLLAFLVTILVALRETDPEASKLHQFKIGLPSLKYSPELNDDIFGIIAGLTGILILFYALFLRRWSYWVRHRWLPRLTAVVLILIVIISGMAYLYGARGIGRGYYVKLWDSYHYFLGPKYYKELGYFDLYTCTVQADMETQKVIKEKNRVRDLRNYGWLNARQVGEQTDCKALFSSQRWEQFKDDLAVYQKRSNLRKMIRDHGYNGTPFHAFIAGKVAQFFKATFTNLTYLSLFDALATLLMMFFVTRAFGWKIGFLFSIFFFINFSDRHYFIGGSYFRYLWMVTLGIGIAMLKEKRYGLSGFFLTTSAMLQVFPLLYFSGIGVKSLWGLIRERRLSKHYKRFIVVSIITALGFGLLSISHGKGLRNYQGFFSIMESHPELITRSRVGFRYNFLFRGEVKPSDPSYSTSKKIQELQELKPVIFTLAAIILAFGLIILVRLDDVEATVLGGFLIFFLWFGTVEYYYASTAVLVLLWHRRVGSAGGAFFLGLLFLIMGLIYIAWHQTRYLLFSNNTATSVLLTSYLLATLIYLAWDTRVFSDLSHFFGRIGGRGKGPEGEPRRHPVIAAAGVVIAFLITPTLLMIGWSCHKPDPSAVPSKPIKWAKGPVLVVGGDVNLGRRQNWITADQGPEAALVGVPQLKEADLAYANLESVIASAGVQGVDKGESASYYYRGRPEMLAVLSKAGIDVVGAGNNHSGDYGPSALMEQLKLMKEMNIGNAGTGKNRELACSPVFRRAGDLTVAFFSVDTLTPQFAATDNKAGTCYFPLKDPEIWKSFFETTITEARKVAHLVFIGIHWGANYKKTPRKAEMKIGHVLIDAGADGVLGTSAHVLQGVEVYKKRPILHDVGNLLFDFSPRSDDDSALFSLVLGQNGVKQIWITPLRVRYGFTQVAQGKRAQQILNDLRKQSKGMNTNLRIQGSQGVISLASTKSKHPNPTNPMLSNPEEGTIPHPLDIAPRECTVKKIPKKAVLTEPQKFGPFNLLGLHIENPIISKRRILWVETFWTIDHPVTKDYWIYERLSAPKVRSWRGEHEPCDWAWPTSRWVQGVIYRDRYGIRPPRKLVDAELDLKIGIRDMKNKKALGRVWKATKIQQKVLKN